MMQVFKLETSSFILVCLDAFNIRRIPATLRDLSQWRIARGCIAERIRSERAAGLQRLLVSQ